MEDNECLNSFGIVHIHNKSMVYHLTRQTLLDSALPIPTDESLTQNTYSFFYDILSFDPKYFNQNYGSFAYIIPRSAEEADLYLNVNPLALDYIINFVQTEKLSLVDDREIDQIVDLATIFAMPDLVEQLRKI
jgi:hypothetical protein